MASNPDFLPVAPVVWECYAQGDGASINSTETFRPSGTITARPSDDNERLPEGTLYRRERRFEMVDGQLFGDLPVDIEGTGWGWTFTASLSFTDGQGKKQTLSPLTFVGVSRLGETLDLKEASKGQLVAGVWTTQGKEGRGIASIDVGAGNVLVATMSDGTQQTTAPLDLSAASPALPAGTDGQVLTWSEAEQGWVAATPASAGGSGDAATATTTADLDALIGA